ncbi:MAG: HlyD family secretion protein, partial [Parasulfuritortus sp.]|nr:HlyD family secretion protein [Parasulfuritortus sp.]
FVFAGAILAVAALVWLVWYLLAGQYYVTTDDAYIEADSSLIAAKVGGYVTNVAVLNGQQVRVGQVLASIDPRDYEAALKAAHANQAAADAASASTTAQLALQQAKIAAASAAVSGDQARLTLAGQNQRRFAKLSANGAGPQQATDEANSGLATAQANLAADQAALLGAEREVDVLNASIKAAQAAQAQAHAQEQQAALDLEHTTITSPVDGVVGNKTVAIGDYLQTGTQIMAVVPLDQVYAVANYKETQITHIHPGQPVTLTVDAFPNLTITGKVESIAPASGQEFALLPPDNATGNFTKIVQRVPIKIDITLTPANLGKLRPGLSIEPTINIRPGA